MLPAAIAAATAGEVSCVTLLRNAPIATAGQSLGPSSSSEASAIPAGGHTGVITP